MLILFRARKFRLELRESQRGNSLESALTVVEFLVLRLYKQLGKLYPKLFLDNV
jgi:hypothetical protein